MISHMVTVGSVEEGGQARCEDRPGKFVEVKYLHVFADDVDEEDISQFFIPVIEFIG